MTTIHAKIPDYLAKLAAEAAAKERTTLDNIVAVALAAHVGAWQVREDIETRASLTSLRLCKKANKREVGAENVASNS